jgi:hypothetical protein
MMKKAGQRRLTSSIFWKNAFDLVSSVLVLCKKKRGVLDMVERGEYAAQVKLESFKTSISNDDLSDEFCLSFIPHSASLPSSCNVSSLIS